MVRGPDRIASKNDTTCHASGAVFLILAALLFSGRFRGLLAEEPGAVEPLPRAHAHNDYDHDRPLLDALARGFTSVEADVFLVSGELLVGHTRGELEKGKTLAALYLDPLHALVRKNGGRVYREGPGFQLLIDFKTAGEATYAALREVLPEYAGMLTTVRDGKLEPGPVSVVISGNRPLEMLRSERVRHAGIDGRIEDLDSDAPADLLPLISDRWGKMFTWRGEGPIPDAERSRLREIVEKAHARGRRVRFWATPERTEVWRELLESGVDHINTDRLDALRDYLLAQRARRARF